MSQPGKFVIAVDVLDVVEVNEVLDVAEELLLVDRQLLTHSCQQSLHQDVLHLNGGKYFEIFYVMYRCVTLTRQSSKRGLNGPLLCCSSSER